MLTPIIAKQTVIQLAVTGDELKDLAIPSDISVHLSHAYRHCCESSRYNFNYRRHYRFLISYLLRHYVYDSWRGRGKSAGRPHVHPKHSYWHRCYYNCLCFGQIYYWNFRV